MATREVAADPLLEWLPRDALFRAAISREKGQWYALAEDFDITGMGDSEVAAVRDMLELVECYLESFFEDGRPFEDALRPIPFRLKAEIRLGSVLGLVIGRMHSRLPLPREGRYVLPPIAHNGAPC